MTYLAQLGSVSHGGVDDSHNPVKHGKLKHILNPVKLTTYQSASRENNATIFVCYFSTPRMSIYLDQAKDSLVLIFHSNFYKIVASIAAATLCS